MTVQDIYELSPMQQGMLFHTLYAPESSAYFEQRSCLLEGDLDTGAFKQAWQTVVERHPVLRTAFYWEEADKPLQVVYAGAELPWIEADWQSLSPEAQAARLEEFLQGDRAQGFSLDQAPMMRCALFQLGPTQYRFVWSHHHLLMDGWCNALLIKEVIAVYTALRQGRSLTLPPTRPYRDYILWLQQQDPTAAEAYWRSALRDFAAPTPLGIGRSTSTRTTEPSAAEPLATEHREQQVSLPQSLTADLRAFVAAHRLTLNTLTQGAWALALSRYSGLSDVVFGATVSGRPPTLPGANAIVGLFINTVPVRVTLPAQTPLLLWLQQIQTDQRDRETYAYSALTDIQFWTDVPQGEPLFESLLVFENYPVSLDAALTDDSSGLTIRDGRGFEQTSYSLALVAIPGETLSIRANYDGDRFTAAEIERLLGHLEAALSGMVADPQQPIDALPLLTNKEQQLIESWNQTERPVPEQYVHEVIAAQAVERPEAIAVVFEEISLSYEELDRRVSELAGYLQQSVKPGDRVAFCLERSPLLVVVVLAILKAGAAYVPLDPTYPAERLRFILGDARVSLLLHDGGLPFDGDGVAAIDISGIGADGDRISTIDPPAPVRATGHTGYAHAARTPLPLSHGDHPTTPHDLAYLIYTSGSTGTPKGVPIRHHSLTNLLTSMAQAPGMGSSDTLLAVTTPAFDIAALELLLPLTVGGTLVIASQEATRDPQQLAQQMQQHSVTLMQATPATWRLLVESGWQGQPDLKLLCGGEALNIALARELAVRGELWNLYGPTETTIWSAALKIEPATLEDGIVPIGRAIANTSFHALDEQNRLVPIGAAGELHIGGAGLSPGYWNRPDLTADRFIANPHSVRAFAQRRRSLHGRSPLPAQSPYSPILYKTGDRVRQREDGTLEYLGRLDHQVKLRGYRIELGEIEAILVQQADVKQAVVVLRDDQLLAYIVTEASTTELNDRLRQRLPSYMVPTCFIILDALPLTPNGKVDRKALPSPEPEAPIEAEAPATPTEELLANIWSAVLNQSSISRKDNFFELGGHSLLATRVVAQVRQAFSVELPLRTLFEQPVLSQMAIAVDRLKAGAPTQLDPIKPIDRTVELPLSDAQQRQWVLAQLEPDSPLYIIPTAVQVTGELSVDLLRQSLAYVVQRHDVLRTAFKEAGGKAQVEIHAEVNVTVPLVDLSELDEPTQQQQVRQYAEAEARSPFDLSHPPLLRMRVLRLAAQRHVILLSLHHIVADGWSMGVLVRELAQSYEALRSGQVPTLPALPIQYVDYAAWQQRQTGRLDYWQQQLQGVPPLLELPTDYPRPATQSFAGAAHEFQLSPEQTQALTRLSQQQGVTLFMTLLAAFQVVLHRYSGMTDLVVGTPIANRPRAELEGLVGMFVNTLALRTDLSGRPTFEALLRRVREVALDAYAHQSTPFEQVVDALAVPRSWSHAPLVQVMFVLQNAPLDPIALPTLAWQPLTTDSGTAKFDLTLSMRPSEQGLCGTLEYRSDLFAPETIQRLAGHLCQVLAAVCEQPSSPIAELPLLSEAERRQLQQWNQTQTAYPSDRCIHQLFEQQAEKTPQAIALVFGDQTLTYEALNARANQLARHLQPVTPDSPIGLWAERGLETIVAMLAILKAGGAYLPLDPGYPRDRLRFMAADAGLSRVVAAKAADLPDGCELVALDTEAVAQNSTANLPSTTAPDSLAYILYTSGSTGQPKGVCTPHRGVVRLVKDTNYADFDADQVFLQAASLSFDASTFEIWGVLLNGGRLILMPASPSLEDLAQAIARHDITTLWLTAGLFHLMVDERLGALRPVRQLLAGGDVLSGAHVRKALAELPHTRLINGYGPTENTTFTCCHPITAESLGASGENSPPIGRPIANTQIYVLDAELQPVPVGVPGELYVGGDGLARGYLNRPELTAERFVPNPFQNHPGLGAGVLYRTGDRVRYRPDGALEYLGRLDNQVKIRGFRIELGEIEAALLGHPDVEQAVVNSRIDEVGGKRLVTYVVLESGSAETSSTLRQFLSETLPDYMLPSAIVPLDALPLTANGKVDRNALSSLPLPAWNSTAQTIPQTLVEQTLSSIWRSVLRLETVGTQDNFFELGGDSILALQMVSRAAQMGISLSPRQIFQHQTIAALAAVAETTGDAPAETFELGEVPLTPIQQWFFAQELANPHHFNQAVFLELPEIDRDRLDRAIQAVVASHDAFRLRFTPTEAGWQQRLTETAAVEPVRWFDLSASPDQDQEVEALANELQASLNIETGPLMRVGGFDLGNRPSRLLVVVHHLIIDGLSWRILLDDLWLAYRENIQDSLSLPKTQSFKQWATWLQSAAEGCEAARPHWQSLPQPALPLEGSDEAVAKTRTTTLALQETQALLEATDGSQIEGLLLTALLRTSTRWTEKRSLLLTLENHGRHSEALGGQLNLSRTLGWFTCLHPLWLQLTGNDLGEQLAAVKTQLQQVPHRGLSYGLLRYGLAPSDADDEALAVQPQVSFNYLGQFDALPTGEFRLLETPGATSDKRNRRSHLIDINAGVRGGQLQVAWTYSHYHSAVVEPLAGQYLAELRSLIAHCQTASAQYSPEDFALADLDQAALEAVLGSVTFQGGQR